MGIGPITLRTGSSAKGRSAPVARPIASWGHKPKRVTWVYWGFFDIYGFRVVNSLSLERPKPSLDVIASPLNFA